MYIYTHMYIFTHAVLIFMLIHMLFKVLMVRQGLHTVCEDFGSVVLLLKEIFRSTTGG